MQKRRGTLAQMSQVPSAYIAAALIPGTVIAVLFWFDHGVSSQLTQHPQVHADNTILALRWQLACIAPVARIVLVLPNHLCLLCSAMLCITHLAAW
jgi:hypothetical protein